MDKGVQINIQCILLDIYYWSFGICCFYLHQLVINTPVSFEIVKLIEVNGWKLPYTLEYLEEIESTNRYFESIPTVAEVVMWLYEKHMIWIVVNLDLVGRW